MDVLKSTRFWILLAIVIAATVALCLSKTTWAEWVALVGGLLGGFGVAKAAPGSASSDVIRALIPVALVGALLSGCICSTPRACLVTSHKALQMADGLALKVFASECMKHAEKCGPVGSAKCPEWVACDKARTAYKAAIDGADQGLAGCNRALDTVGVK